MGGLIEWMANAELTPTIFAALTFIGSAGGVVAVKVGEKVAASGVVARIIGREPSSVPSTVDIAQNKRLDAIDRKLDTHSTALADLAAKVDQSASEADAKHTRMDEDLVAVNRKVDKLDASLDLVHDELAEQRQKLNTIDETQLKILDALQVEGPARRLAAVIPVERG